MTLDEYQKLAARTAALHQSYGLRVAVLALGVAGEAGEVADLIKKTVGHNHPVELDKLKKELGDVLWYVAMLASEYGINLNDVAEANVTKLKARYPEGFSSEASINRKGES